ncbi:hypothetical protein PENTCL1PPCAC_10533, partial [Pristionchus entomophagus]
SLDISRMGLLFIHLLTFGFAQLSVQWTEGRIKRGAPASSWAKIWPNPIPFTINSQYNEEQEAKIKAGINSLMQKHLPQLHRGCRFRTEDGVQKPWNMHVESRRHPIGRQ